MRTAGRCLVLGWLLAALVLLALDGRLPAYLACTVPGTALVLGTDALVRWHRRPSRYCRPSLPERYRVADDLRRPLVEVVAVAEREALAGRDWPMRLPPTCGYQLTSARTQERCERRASRRTCPICRPAADAAAGVS